VFFFFDPDLLTALITRSTKPGFGRALFDLFWLLFFIANIWIVVREDNLEIPILADCMIGNLDQPPS